MQGPSTQVDKKEMTESWKHPIQAYINGGDS